MDYTQQEIFILSLGALGIGMYLLFKGGDWTIDGAVYLAKRFGISPLMIGFTIVAFGTSFPELIVSVNANLGGSPGLALGNVIGSNIANILLVLGTTAMITTLIAVPRDLLRDIVMLLAASTLMIGLMLHGAISQVGGGMMITVLFAYIAWQYMMARKGAIEVEELSLIHI